MQLIPKVIHCCWLSGDPIPEKYLKCIDSWKKYLSDYTIKMWTKENFDINSVPWVKQAYEAKAYAFASDYIRAWALYNEGGIYLDMDVEVYKNFDKFLELPYFIGREVKTLNSVECAVMGFKAHANLPRIVMDYYKYADFTPQALEAPLVYKYMLNRLFKNVEVIYSPELFKNSRDTLQIFAKEVFSPKDFQTGEINKTKNTICCHHFFSEWRKTLNRPFTNYAET